MLEQPQMRHDFFACVSHDAPVPRACADLLKCGLALVLALCAILPGRAGAQADAPFLWEVEGPKVRHYLLGSLHLLPEAAAELPDALERAYLRADELMFESDIATLSAPHTQLTLLAAAKGERPLKASIAPPLYERLRRRAEAVRMPMAVCEPFRAWFCALTLEIFSYQNEGFRPEFGLDQQFFQRAVADDKPLHWLEEPPAHLALFTGMPEAQAEQFLAATVDELTGVGSEPAELLRMWKAGDSAALEQMTVELKAQAPALYERLLVARNRAWLPRLQAALDGPAVQLIVVGAAHLYGPDGLIALLQQKGYRLRPVAAAAEPQGGAPLRISTRR